MTGQESFNRNGKWSNEIKGKIIEEEWLNKSISRLDITPDLRVLFAKNSSHQYVFLGIYKWIRNDTERSVKVFEQISDVYYNNCKIE